MARIVTSIASQSIDAFQEFLSRLTNDLSDLSEISGAKTLSLESVTFGLSDPHNGGKTVVRVCFSNDVTFYYKPRDLAPEHNWISLLNWLEAVGGPRLDRYPIILSRTEYGWQRACSRLACPSPQLYFWNLGFELALFRMVGSSDMHHENVIASGNTPVFIDLETLFSPIPRYDIWPNNALRTADSELAKSVWRTGVLPDATLLPSGAVMVFGALAETPATTGPLWGFEKLNTDDMSFVLLDRPTEAAENLPLHHEVVSARRHLNELEDGFRRGMGLMEQNWEEFSALLDQLAPTSTRAIFRPTAVYAAALHTLRDPRRLRSGIGWSARLDFDKGDRQSLGILGNSTLVDAERRALVRGDIPFFAANELGAVSDSMGCVVCDAVEPRLSLESLQPPTVLEIERDVRLIRWSVGGLGPAEMRAWPDTKGDLADSRHVIVSELGRIVEVIIARAVVADDGAAWWGRISLLSAPSIAVLGPGLYDGIAGIGLFLAVAGESLDIEQARHLARKSFQTVGSMVRRHRPSSAAPQRTIGLASGMCGIAYAALLSSDLPLACEAASWVTEDSIACDRAFDLLNGSAGALITMLHLWEATQESVWLEKALRCGQHLVDAHRARPYWRSEQGISAGMAHGLSGIGLALCRLAHVCHRDDFLELGLNSLEKADGAYDRQSRDWAAQLVEAPSTMTHENYWNRWCHGAVGIGFAWNDQAVKLPTKSADVVMRAIEASLENPTRPYDNLCCGNFGHIDFLLEMSKAESYRPLRAVAWQRACWLISERKRTGYICDDAQEESALGLFSGISGIGYTLARLLNPTKVPSLLALLPITGTTSLS